VFYYILGKVYPSCQDKIVEWFASLNGMTQEEFLNAPPEYLLETVEDIATSPESKDFFSKAYRLYRRIGVTGKTTTAA
jgi:hypothetical protein